MNRDNTPEPAVNPGDAKHVDVAVIGAGAAGLLCAIEAGRRGRRVALLEHNGEIGRKIRISGGGRCNFTNVNASPEHYISANPRFSHSALARFTPADIVELVERHGIPYYEKKLGQLFCRDSAEPLIEALQTDCARAGVAIRTSSHVERVEKDERFLLVTSRETWSAESLAVACGGLSIPKIGATDFGYELARQFGHRVLDLHPALVPFIYDEADLRDLGDLSGISADARVTCNGVTFRENILFTHRGLSGPAILQISSYWNDGDTVEIDLLPDLDLAEWLRAEKHRQTKTEWATALVERLPQRLVRRWAEWGGGSRPIYRLTESEIDRVATAFHRFQFVPGGTEGYRKAEVTRGGVDTRELSPQTMESKRVPGLYFIGEVVDVTGWLGGYNFQWAWSSGYAAGQVV